MSSFDLNKDLSDAVVHGRKTIGGTATQLFSNSLPNITKGVQFKAAAGNANTIYVGSTPVVTAGTDADTDGFPLAAGEGLFVPIRDASKIHAIAGAAGQELYWLMV